MGFTDARGEARYLDDRSDARGGRRDSRRSLALPDSVLGKLEALGTLS